MSSDYVMLYAYRWIIKRTTTSNIRKIFYEIIQFFFWCIKVNYDCVVLCYYHTDKLCLERLQSSFMPARALDYSCFAYLLYSVATFISYLFLMYLILRGVCHRYFCCGLTLSEFATWSALPSLSLRSSAFVLLSQSKPCGFYWTSPPAKVRGDDICDILGTGGSCEI